MANGEDDSTVLGGFVRRSGLNNKPVRHSGVHLVESWKLIGLMQRSADTTVAKAFRMSEGFHAVSCRSHARIVFGTSRPRDRDVSAVD